MARGRLMLVAIGCIWLKIPSANRPKSDVTMRAR
jgi:hypothetical protein